MGGPNLEVFKFGMYIMFPIGIMYYFGTNLDSRFATPDFWPKPGQTHTIPFEKDEITEELQRLKANRLAARQRRLQLEGGFPGQQEDGQQSSSRAPSPMLQSLQNTSTETVQNEEREGSGKGSGRGWSSWFR